MDMTKMIERFEDAHLVAIFQLYPEQFKIKFKRSPLTGRVYAEVEGDPSSFQRVLQFLSDNEAIPCRSYIEELRKVKTEIFRLKGSTQ
jgi:hypothetical protein